MDGGRLQPFDGDLDDYKVWPAQAQKRRCRHRPMPDKAADKASRKAEREAAAADRQARLAARRPLLKEPERLGSSSSLERREKTKLDRTPRRPGLTPPRRRRGAKLLPGRNHRQGRRRRTALAELHEAWKPSPPRWTPRSRRQSRRRRAVPVCLPPRIRRSPNQPS